ncbi:MAG: glycoside hydrolase family 32 protein [Clostridia bacterium]|nr:glycoside hydrolase family 32 protein [Clostridia bacterium]
MSELKIIVKAGFLVLPVSNYVANHQLRFLKDGKVFDDITLRLDYRNPTAYSYYPLADYMGQEITLSASPDMELRDLQTDTPEPNGTGEAFRPILHFTPVYGWHNDPNGLLKYTSPVTGKTTWHMFYQLNPYDWIWGNMHWGHAVSEDLFHWQHLDPALYPDDEGTMFSGSAVVDRENRSGLRTGEEDVILLFYTCAGNTSFRSQGKKFTQCLAYSNDGGMTFTKYEKNPVVDHITADNRDPKVIWCEELGKYVMALYLDRSDYQLLTSENLLDWEPLQTLQIARDAECPDFYPLNADGKPQKRKWILSGASHNYIVCEAAGGRFKVIQNSRPLSNGSCSYAAQTFSTDYEMERIQIAWNRNCTFGNAPICGQMSIPCNMSLTERKDGYYLCASPVRELDSLCREVREFTDVNLSETNSLRVELEEGAYELDLAFDSANVPSNVRIDIFGQQILLESVRNTIRVDRDTMPISVAASKPELRCIIDKGSIEIFVSGGKAMMTTPWTLNYNHCYAVFSVEGDKPVVIERIALKKLTL